MPCHCESMSKDSLCRVMARGNDEQKYESVKLSFN